jgi:hypothetical protein
MKVIATWYSQQLFGGNPEFVFVDLLVIIALPFVVALLAAVGWRVLKFISFVIAWTITIAITVLVVARMVALAMTL